MRRSRAKGMASGSDAEQQRTGITKVDLRGLEPGGSGWKEAQAAVTASMVAHGCVVVAHDALGPELRRALFGRAMPELFALPVETKQMLICGPVNGYIGPRPAAPAYESLRFSEATDANCVRGYVNVLWPQGNPEFCETVGEFVKNMLKLEQTVETMVLESLGAQKEHVDSHLESLAYYVRLAHYGALPETETTGMFMLPHRDATTLSMIMQHDVEGLEVQAKDGIWLAVPPEPDALAVMAGELLTVVTNGRVPPCVHRVRTPSNRERISALFASVPRDGCTANALDELVGEDHPLMYNPCNIDEYTKFRFVDGGSKLSDPLKAFCGVVKDDQP